MSVQKETRWYNIYGEGLILSTLATVAFFITNACNPPVWVKYGQTSAWIFQQTAIVCVDVPQEVRPEIFEAIYAWDTAIEKWKHLIPRTGINNTCDYTIIEMEPGIFDNPNVLAKVDSIGGRNITLYRGRYEQDAVSITLHELGHAFGARHMAGTLMGPKLQYNAYKCPDAATVAQVAVANGVDPSLLNWCQND